MTLTELHELERKTLTRLQELALTHKLNQGDQIAACATLLGHINTVRYGAEEANSGVFTEVDPRG